MENHHPPRFDIPRGSQRPFSSRQDLQVDVQDIEREIEVRRGTSTEAIPKPSGTSFCHLPAFKPSTTRRRKR